MLPAKGTLVTSEAEARAILAAAAGLEAGPTASLCEAA